MNREIHDLVQGSDDWRAFRLAHYGASEAAAMLGMSKHMTRSELLAIKHSGTPREFGNFVQERILDRGHELEDLARPIAEEILGEDLYPATSSYGNLSASCDGLTMDGLTAFEHKQYNAGLFEAVARGELPEEYQPQCQQVMLVTGAERLLFMVSDGTREKCAHLFVFPNPQWEDKLIAAWGQFDLDLAAYQHVEVLPAAVAAPTMSLPALSIQVTGSISLIDNLEIFGTRLVQFIGRIDQNPSDDQAFADTEAAIKTLSAAEDALKAAESSALAQTSSIDEMRRTVALYAEQARATRLMLEKIVKARKETIRVEIVQGGKVAFSEHIHALNTRIGKAYMPLVPTDFPGVIKGKKTVSSLRDAVDTELARAKIEASAIADRIQLNMTTLRELAKDHAFLFADTGAIVLKQNDDFTALVKTRIAEHKTSEEKRLEAEREKIRAEEQAKLKREQERVEEEIVAKEKAEAARAAAIQDIPLSNATLAGLDRVASAMPAKPAPKPHFATPVAAVQARPTRPTDEQIIATLALHYRVHESKIVAWLLEIDLESLSKSLMKEFD